LMQTFQPQHPVMQALVSGDASAFYEREIIERERAQLPPYGRLVSIIVSADTRAEAEGHARALRQTAPVESGITILGPAEAPLALIRGRHRFRLLVHGRRSSDMQAFVRGLLERGPKERRSIQVQVDVDPQSFL
jgi:primosomal protein N' (replication factor Y) (superfamily II helicase)